ncbi:McrB family protein [Prevotella sp. E13-27]|uniref:McrB family protein n=1 Tax=Prevotella sp. E13-27 TaxID=2938122 RepID=UPI00200B97E6|nr:AAA family ATPase [Prevotella sp. E13-27]MCK8622294.1 AAA family ATPase [Prevotella sp. E13-27]
MNMSLLEICQQLPDIDVSEFHRFTSKWINYVKSNTTSDNIPESDWNQLFTRSNPVAGIDRGEMQDRIKQRNGERETNERRSFVSNWNKIFLPILKGIINPDSGNRIEKIKDVRDTMRNVIIQGGGRNTKAAINRMLITFCPDILIRIPNEDNTKEFMELLRPFSNPDEPLTANEDWVDNSTNIMEFLKRQLGETIQKRTIWDVYISLKNSDKRYSMATNNERETSMLDKYTSLLKTNKNLILTGAPGTGKTFLAKDIAAQMILNKSYEEVMDDEEDKDLFSHYSDFVQFHPSYDYTDFVEGLRTKNDTNGNVGFERKDGVFKRFCKRLFTNDLLMRQEDVFEPIYQSVYDAIEKGRLKHLKTPYGSFEVGVEKGRIVYGSDRRTESKDNLKLLYDHFFLKNKFDLSDLHKDDYWNLIAKLTEGKTKTCDYVYYSGILQKMLDIADKKYEEDNTPYIFIIDEINRGEISKIFGELFFSIDPGYRGEKGKVNTQYQNMVAEGDVFKNGFYVPENVYIIGTMNDIDRSVESMDFAMRRRFAWQEVTAEESYTNMIEQDPEFALAKDEIKARMFNLNKAIVETEGLDEAYQIGAAYFRKYLDYQDKTNPFDCLWENHLKGLLFEYLRGNRRAKELLEKLHDAYNKKSLNE